jgi:hypothetical protein
MAGYDECAALSHLKQEESRQSPLGVVDITAVGRINWHIKLNLASMFKRFEIVDDEVVSENTATRRCIGNSLW